MGTFYDLDGWIDVPAIDDYANRHNISFIFIIGRRQVGKTYGVLKYMLDQKKTWILMRRTKQELKLLKNEVNSPFEAIPEYAGRVGFDGSEDGTVEMFLTTDETAIGHGAYDEYFGMAVALSTVASIRGFSGGRYSDLVYDECIPENHVYKIKNEDEAFLNAYTTINGNRELRGEKPLRCWLLSNANKLDAAILRAFDLVEVTERMWLTGSEELLLKERGILILMPKSQHIIEKRSETALYRAAGTKSQFAKMSLNGDFSHDDTSDIKKVDIRQYQPICRLDDMLVCKHKSDGSLYVCKKFPVPGIRKYDDTEYYRNYYRRTHPSHRMAYLKGQAFFQNVAVKTKFLKFISE